MMTVFQSLLEDQDGQSMVEYGVIVAVIAAVCVAGFSQVGQKINGALDTLSKNMPAGQ